jgi:hypothetical protein
LIVYLAQYCLDGLDVLACTFIFSNQITYLLLAFALSDSSYHSGPVSAAALAASRSLRHHGKNAGVVAI